MNEIGSPPHLLTSSPPHSLIECIPNFSEGRDRATIDAIVDAIRSAGVTLVDHSADPDHHRMVVTFLGPPDAVAEAAFAGAREAIARIDLNRHRGAHPRMGAVDVIPLVPLGDTPMATCVAVAHALGERLGRELALPVYYYEDAALRPDRRDLARVRAGGFEALRGATNDQRPTSDDEAPGSKVQAPSSQPDTPERLRRTPTPDTPAKHQAPSTEHRAPSTPLDGERAPDAGPAVCHPTAGAVAVGARGPLIAYNIFLDTDDVRVARTIAGRIRQRGGGLPGVKALGLFLSSRGRAQVSINVTDPDRVSLARVFARVRQEAARLGVGVAGSELVGALRLDDLLAVARDTLGLRGLEPHQVLDLSLTEGIRDPPPEPTPR